MKKILYVLTLSLILLAPAYVNAQDILRSKDLSTIKVDALSQNDLIKISEQLKSNGMTIDQAESMAVSKGMSSEEFNKLRVRLNALGNSTSNNSTTKENNKIEFGRSQEKITNIKVKDSANSLIFGSDLFDNPNLNFEPDLKLATPMNYILGPGDELQVSVYGIQEYSATVPVSVEGKITIQNVGQIAVSGMLMEAASQKIKSAIGRV